MSQLMDSPTSIGMQQGYFGKYRGTVVQNADPENRARIMALVPDVLGTARSSWAMPSLPWCGPNMGMACIPPIGAGVWIEFEQGDRDYPIWCGCFWGSAAEVPSAAEFFPPSPGITFQTFGQNLIQLTEFGIKLKTKAASIEMDESHVSIKHGAAEIILQGLKVSINGNALEII